jgi:hypothetical protein
MSERVELPRAERCETCRWWRHDHGTDEKFPTLRSIEQFNDAPVGECRRMPPGARPHGRENRAFPWTWTDDWCGEWRAKGGGPEDRYQEFLGKLSVRACRNLSESRRSAYYFMDGIRYPPITSFEQLLATPPPIVRDRKGIGPTSLLQIYDTLKDMNVPLSGLWDRPRDKFHLGGLSGLEAHREK